MREEGSALRCARQRRYRVADLRRRALAAVTALADMGVPNGAVRTIVVDGPGYVEVKDGERATVIFHNM